MGWPRQIFVATVDLGVYYTGNFVDPGTQPTWTAINTGLPTTDCRQFFIDPFAPEDKQYVLLTTDRTIYMRESGTWTAIFSPADARTILGTPYGTLEYFCTDPSVAGRLWASFAWADGIGNESYWAFYSDDYGASWAVTTSFYGGSFGRGLGVIWAYGDTVYTTYVGQLAVASYLAYSNDKGNSWNRVGTDQNYVHAPNFNKTQYTKVWTGANHARLGPTSDLTYVTNAGASANMQQLIMPTRPDNMWFSLSDVNHHRIVRFGKLYVTTDGWATVNVPNIINPVPYSIAWQVTNDDDSMLVELTLGTHVIGVLEGDADVVATGIAGANAGGAPYVDSIPDTCGGLAYNGIHAIPLDANVYTYDIDFEVAGQDGSVHTTGVELEVAAQDSSVHTSEVSLE